MVLSFYTLELKIPFPFLRRGFCESCFTLGKLFEVVWLLKGEGEEANNYTCKPGNLTSLHNF